VLHLLTIVTDDFWPGFAALLQSLEDNSGLQPHDFKISVVCDLDKAPQNWLADRRSRVELVSLDVLPSIKVLSPQDQGRRMEGALQKIGLFALPEEWGSCVFIDSDMVCLGDIRLLRDTKPLAAANDQIRGMGGTREVADRGAADINTGLLVFKPSRKVFEELRTVYAQRHGERTHKGDQDVINMWIDQTGHSVYRLGSEWNFSKRFQDEMGLPWVKKHINQVKFLHFVGVKPWTSNGQIRTARECRYRWLEEIWWDYFDRSELCAHIDKPLRRSSARVRAWVLPWSQPAILQEHVQRAARFARLSRK
jgi:hypothetical protein